MIGRAAALTLIAMSLAGCASVRGHGSIAGGECKVFEAPKYAVRGATQYDQDWIDPTIEGGIGACKWKRPAPRSATLDAPRAKSKPIAAAPVKKPGIIARTKAKLWPAVPVAPVIDVPEAPVVPEVAAEPVPRSAIDELLHPSEWPKR